MTQSKNIDPVIEKHRSSETKKIVSMEPAVPFAREGRRPGSWRFEVGNS